MNLQTGYSADLTNVGGTAGADLRRKLGSRSFGTFVCQKGAYLRLIDSFITHLKAQGPSRTCNESKEEEEEGWGVLWRGDRDLAGGCPRRQKSRVERLKAKVELLLT